jgi:hypothetical protein
LSIFSLLLTRTTKLSVDIEVFPRIQGARQEVDALLDTREDENWISQRLANRLLLDLENTSPLRYVAGRSYVSSSSKAVKLTWCFVRDAVKYQAMFHVSPDPNPVCDVLFGSHTQSVVLANMKHLAIHQKDFQVCRSLFTLLLLNDFPLGIRHFSDKREPVQTLAASGFVSPYP